MASLEAEVRADLLTLLQGLAWPSFSAALTWTTDLPEPGEGPALPRASAYFRSLEWETADFPEHIGTQAGGAPVYQHGEKEAVVVVVMEAGTEADADLFRDHFTHLWLHAARGSGNTGSTVLDRAVALRQIASQDVRYYLEGPIELSLPGDSATIGLYTLRVFLRVAYPWLEAEASPTTEVMDTAVELDGDTFLSEDFWTSGTPDPEPTPEP